MSAPEGTLHHYIIVRKDLPSGTKLAQTGHASGESAMRPLPEGTFLYVLHADDEDHLLRLAEKLRKSACPHIVVREPDEPFHGAATAIGCVPTLDRKRIQKVTKGLQLAS
jgi:hypothetical protein